MYDDKIVADVKLITANLMGFALFLVMSLRHHSVGVDTGQYLFRYNHVIYPLNFDIFLREEWIYHGFASILKNLGISEQGYLAIYAFVVTFILTRFFLQIFYQ